MASDLFYYEFASGTRGTADEHRRRGGAGHLQPGRPAGGLRARPQPVRGRRRGAARARAHDRRQQRRSSTASSIGCIRRRSTAAATSRASGGVPDSSRLAFLQLDERPVPEYTVIDHIPYRPALEVTDYPKAGDPNPRVRLGVVARGGRRRSCGPTPSAYAEHRDPDRQRELDARLAAGRAPGAEPRADLARPEPGRCGARGRTRTLLRETTKAWVNEIGNPMWLKDGSFLWLSERTGFKHLYRYRDSGTGRPRSSARSRAAAGTCARSTAWTRARGLVYFSSPEPSALDLQVYRIGLDGADRTRAVEDGRHAPGHASTRRFTRYVDRWSDADHADAGAAARRRRRASCASSTPTRCRRSPSTGCRARSSCR